MLAQNDIAGDDELILRRVQLRDGRTRAFVNDQPVGAQVLKSLGAALVEIHGQHDERALVDAATHRALLDAFGGLDRDAQAVAQLWEDRRAREAEVAAHRAAVERAQREADWLRHAVEELTRLAPEPSEETALADRRAAMMAAEKVAGDLRDAHEAVAGGQSPVPALAAAVRRLERRAVQAPALIEPAAKAFDAALSALEDARAHLEEALRVADHDPHELERIEERLFALRAAARKYNVPVDGLSALATRHAAELGSDRCRRRDVSRHWKRRRVRPSSAIGWLRHALGGAAQDCRQARQGGQWRAEAAQARTREVLDRDRDRAGRRRAARDRPCRVLGAAPILAPGQGR